MRLLCVSHIQMLEFFMQYHEAGFFFSDGKLENFLCFQDVYTGEYQLQVLDLKSTRYLDKEGYYHAEKQHEVLNLPVIYTKGVTPPEVIKGVRSSADKASVCMFGMNLYMAATGRRLRANRRKYKIREFEESHFSKHALFKTAAGEQIKKLVMDCVKQDPDHRISCAEALVRLKHIYPCDLERLCRARLEDLKQLDPYSPVTVDMTYRLNKAADSMDRQGLKHLLYALQRMIKDALILKMRHIAEHVMAFPEEKLVDMMSFRRLLQEIKPEHIKVINSNLEEHCRDLYKKIKKINRSHDLMGKVMVDQNLEQELQLLRKALQSPDNLSFEHWFFTHAAFSSLLYEIKNLMIQVSTVMKDLSPEQAINCITALRLFPVRQRFLIFGSKDAEAREMDGQQALDIVKKLLDFKTSHDLLKKINAYRYENLSSHPVMVDVIVRRYLHEKMEALYRMDITVSQMKNLRKKIATDLLQLQISAGVDLNSE
jgi:hypothetical protein